MQELESNRDLRLRSQRWTYHSGEGQPVHVDTPEWRSGGPGSIHGAHHVVNSPKILGNHGTDFIRVWIICEVLRNLLAFLGIIECKGDEEGLRLE